MPFPTTRLRRLRQNEQLRSLVRETRLSPETFVYPLFVCPGEGVRKEVRSMPGVFNLSVDEAVKEAREAQSLGLGGIILFGLPERKDEVATGAWADDGIVQQATRAIKREVPKLTIIGDVCLCEYMSHGHCGVVKAARQPQSLGAAVADPMANRLAGDSRANQGNEYEIVNDATLEILAKTSVSQARAGVDVIAPSDMMDGANIREAMREIELDIEEGADMIMVKPAMPYLDVIAAARERFDLPLAAYQVSGEYAMIEAAARNGWIERERVMLESLVSIRRAGAGTILTYYAKAAAKLMG